MFNQKSIAKYSGSAPINYRLIVINTLLIVGCIFVLIESRNALGEAMADMDNVARKAAGAPPCGLAVPRTKFVLQAVREISDDAFTDVDESKYVERVQKAFCSASSVSNSLRAAFQTNDIPESCCNEGVAEDDKTDIDAAVNDYLCKCDSEGCNTGASFGYGDIVRRITHAYALAAPAFAMYVDFRTADVPQKRCTTDYDPFAEAVCGDADARASIDDELEKAAENSIKILSGADESFPSTTEMLYRLMLLSVVEYNDRTFNQGRCFKNLGESDGGPLGAVALCDKKLESSKAKGDGDRPMGTMQVKGCVDPQLQTYYVEGVGQSESCDWKYGDPEEERQEIEPEPREDRRFSAEYKDQTPVVAVCSSLLEFGLLDQKRLFGLPDPVSKFDFYGANHGNSFTRWMAGWAYYGLFDANVDAAIAEKHVPYLDLKLYAGYRLAATAAWAIAAMASAGYLLTFACVPMAKLLYVRMVRRNVTDSATETIVLKPPGTAEYVALILGELVGLWIIFVDPGSWAPFVIDDQCENYAAHGGPFPTSELRARRGLLGLALAIVAGGTLVYAGCCRRVPRRQRIMPLNPFSLWPILLVATIVLLAVIILSIRAGNDWWETQSTDLNSDQKSTTDLEEILWAAFWIMGCIGLLTGVLNQRHMAANAVLEVPLGRPPIFAYAWAGAGFTFSVLAAAFAWPLFDCQIGLTTNQFVCGNGVEVGVNWSYFWGCIAFVLTVVSVLFVFFAAYRVLFRIPRKNDPAVAAFSRAKAAEVAQLAARRFGLPGAPPAPLPATPTPISAATFPMGGVVSASFVISDEENEQTPLKKLVPQTVSMAPVVAR